VACPFFLPARRLDSGGWTPPPRLPLGDAFGGSCGAPSAAGTAEPPEDIQRDLCNSGYARGRCAHFPNDCAADAVRFSVTGERDGRLTLVYILEKDHAPLEHGLIDHLTAAREPLASQARAFMDTQLRRRAALRSESASA
jgi:hypothetical protein